MEDKRYNEWIKPGIYNGLQKISIPLFGILSTAFLAHEVLPKSDMAVWVLFLTITAFVEIFRAGIVRTALIKFMNYGEVTQQKQVLSSAFILNVFISTVAIIILVLGGNNIAEFLKVPQLQDMLLLFSGTIIILIFFSHFEWIMYGKLRFRELYFCYMIRQGSTLLGIVIAYFLLGSVSLNLLVILYSLGVLLGGISGYYMTKDLFNHRLYLSMMWIKRLFSFGKYVFGTNVSALGFRNADQFMLSNITANRSMVASQGISMRVINIADIPSQVIGDLLFPRSSNPLLNDHPDQIKSFYEKAVGASLSFVLPFIVFALLFPKLIIMILAGKEYYDAIPYLRLVSFAALFLAFLKQWGVIIDSTGRPQVNFLLNLLLALVQIGLCYFFISRFQLLGAAYALLITHLVGFIITQIILYNYFKINFINCFKYALRFYPELFKLGKRFLNIHPKSVNN